MLHIPEGTCYNTGMKLLLELAGVPVELDCLHDDYYPIFEPYQRAPQAEDAPLSCARACVSPRRCAAAAAIYPPESSEAYVEYMELCPVLSSALLPFGRAIFHAVAFLWQGRAWLLTAPSGTGKSTQYCQWKLLYGDQLQIINGDKPIVYEQDGDVYVTSSPWTGKEMMSQRLAAPLGGVLCLEQAEENRIRRLRAREAVGPLYAQFLYDHAGSEEVRAVCRLVEAMLRRPVWLLENRGDADSVRLCRKTLSDWLDGERAGETGTGL